MIRIYAAQGHRRFLLLTGYLGEQIADFVAAEAWPEPVEVECVDTGLDTPTGGRVARAARPARRRNLPRSPTPTALADIDLAALDSTHREPGALATMTVVRPRTQWGVALIDGSERVTGFREKPRLDDWVNGGFFVCEPRFLDYLGPDCVLEREPLERLAADRRLGAYRHHGFWDCMDTYKDAVTLNDLWRSGHPPWCVWQREAAPAG